jgi:uncharacterized membrane protein
MTDLPPPVVPDAASQTGSRPASRSEEHVPIDGDDIEALFGISFDNALRAQEFLLALTRLATQRDLVLRDAVVVVKDDEGKVRVRESIDPQPGTSAMSGAVWTGLLGLLLGGPIGWLAGLGLGAGAGALMAKFVDLGIPDEWVDWFKDAVRPDTATVVALASGIKLDALYQEAARFPGATLVHATLAPGASAHLAAALEAGRGDDQSDLSSPA